MKKLENTNIILQIIVGIIIIAQFVYTSKEIILNGLESMVPAWTLMLSSLVFIVFVMLIFFKKWFQIRKIFRKSHTFNFNWQDSNPESNGWTCEVDEATTNKPTLNFLTDGSYGRVLEIKPTSRYYLETSIPAPYRDAEIYEVIIKPGEFYQFYARIKVISQNKKHKRAVWLAFTDGTGIMTPFAEGTNEWKIELPPQRLKFGWLKFSINLSEIVDKTFGQEGWQFDEFSSIRLRGELVIAEINIY